MTLGISKREINNNVILLYKKRYSDLVNQKDKKNMNEIEIP